MVESGRSRIVSEVPVLRDREYTSAAINRDAANTKQAPVTIIAPAKPSTSPRDTLLSIVLALLLGITGAATLVLDKFPSENKNEKKNSNRYSRLSIHFL